MCGCTNDQRGCEDALMTNDIMTNDQKGCEDALMTNDIMTNDQNGCADDNSVCLSSVSREDKKGLMSNTPRSQTTINNKFKAAPA